MSHAIDIKEVKVRESVELNVEIFEPVHVVRGVIVEDQELVHSLKKYKRSQKYLRFYPGRLQTVRECFPSEQNLEVKSERLHFPRQIPYHEPKLDRDDPQKYKARNT